MATMSNAAKSLPHTTLNHSLRTVAQSFRSKVQALQRADQNDQGVADHCRVRIVMGNEAGDLDSVACALAFSLFSQIRDPSQQAWVPLVQTRRQDFKLRPENEMALAACLVDESNIVSLDEFEEWERLAGDGREVEAVLVDHCKLSARWKGNITVRGVLDHHADEGLYKDASPREILPPTDCGSCASLISRHFKDLITDSKDSSEIARLLLAAIAIDTHNLDRQIGKAKPIDYDAASLLGLIAALGEQSLLTVATTHAPKCDLSSLDSMYHALSKAKEDVSHLSTRDLCRRDYKQYDWPSKSGDKNWRVGLTSVPWSLEEWTKRDGQQKFLEGCDAFCKEADIHFLGVLCSFSHHGVFRREALIYASAPDGPSLTAVQEVMDRIEKDKREELTMERLALDGFSASERSSRFVRVWEQKNLKATRKQVAPAFKDVCAQVPAP